MSSVVAVYDDFHSPSPKRKLRSSTGNLEQQQTAVRAAVGRNTHMQYTLVFPPGQMGLELEPVITSNERTIGCRVKDYYFSVDHNGIQEAVLRKHVSIGDIISSVNDNSVVSLPFLSVLQMLRALNNAERTVVFKNITASWQQNSVPGSSPINVQRKKGASTAGDQLQKSRGGEIMDQENSFNGSPLAVRNPSQVKHLRRELSPARGLSTSRQRQSSRTSEAFSPKGASAHNKRTVSHEGTSRKDNCGNMVSYVSPLNSPPFENRERNLSSNVESAGMNSRILTKLGISPVDTRSPPAQDTPRYSTTDLSYSNSGEKLLGANRAMFQCVEAASSPLTPSAIVQLKQQRKQKHFFANSGSPTGETIQSPVISKMGTKMVQNYQNEISEPSAGESPSDTSLLGAAQYPPVLNADAAEGIKRVLERVGGTISSNLVSVGTNIVGALGQQTEMALLQTSEHIPRYSSRDMSAIMANKYELLNELSRSAILLGQAEEKEQRYADQAQLNQMLQQRVAQLEAAAEVSQQVKEVLTSKVKAAEEKLAEYKKEHAAEVKELVNSKVQLELMKKQLNEQEHQHSEVLQSEKDRFCAAIEAQRVAEESLATVVKEKEEISAKLHIVEADRIEAMAALEVSRDTLQTEVDAVRSENSRLQGAMQSMQDAHKEALASRGEELRHLRMELTSTQTALSNTSSSSAAAQSQCEALRVELDKKNNSVDDLISKNQDCEKECQVLREEKDATASEVIKLSDELQHLRTICSTSEEQAHLAQNSQKLAELAAEAQKSENFLLVKEIDELRNLLSAKNLSLRALEAQCSEYEDQVRTMKDLTGKNERMENEIQQLNDQLTAAGVSLNDKDAALQKNAARVAELEGLLQAITTDAKNDLSKMRESMEQTIINEKQERHQIEMTYSKDIEDKNATIDTLRNESEAAALMAAQYQSALNALEVEKDQEVKTRDSVINSLQARSSCIEDTLQTVRQELHEVKEIHASQLAEKDSEILAVIGARDALILSEKKLQKDLCKSHEAAAAAEIKFENREKEFLSALRLAEDTHQSMLSELQQQLAARDDQAATAIKSHEIELANLRDVKESALSELKEKNHVLQKSEQELQTLKEQYDAVKNKLSTAEEELIAEKQRVRALEIKSLEEFEKCEQTSAEQCRLELQCTDLRSQLEQSTRLRSQDMRKVAELETKLEDEQHMTKRLLQEIKECQSGSNKAIVPLKQALRNAQFELQLLKSQLLEVRVGVVGLQTTHENVMNSVTASAEQNQNQLVDQKRENVRLVEVMNTLRQENAVILQRARDSENKLSSSEKRCLELSSQLMMKDSSIAEEMSKKSLLEKEIESLSKEVVGLTSSQKQYQKESDELRQELDDVRKQHAEEILSAREEICGLQKTLKNILDTKRALEQSLAAESASHKKSNRDCDSYQRRIEDLDDKLSKQMEYAVEVNVKLSESNVLRDELEQRCVALEAAIDHHKEEVALKSQMLDARTAELTAARSGEAESSSALRKKINSLETSIANHNTAVQEMEKNLADGVYQLSLLQSENANIKADRDSLHEQLICAENEKEQQRTSLITKHKEESRVIFEQLASVQLENTQLKDNMETLRSEFASNEQNLRGSQASEQQIADQLKIREQELAALTEVCSVERVAAQTHSDRIIELHAEIERTAHETTVEREALINRYETQLQIVSQKHDDSVSLLRERNSEIEILNSDLAEIRSQYKQLQDLHAVCSVSTATLDELRAQEATSRSELAALQVVLEVDQKKLSDAEKLIIELQRCKNDLAQELCILKQQLSANEAQQSIIEELQQQLIAAQRAIESRESELQLAKEELNGVKEQLLLSKEQCSAESQWKEAVEIAETKADGYRTSMEHLFKEVEYGQKTVEDLSKQIKTLEVTVASKDQHCDRLRAQISELRATINAQQQVIIIAEERETEHQTIAHKLQHSLESIVEEKQLIEERVGMELEEWTHKYVHPLEEEADLLRRQLDKSNAQLQIKSDELNSLHLFVNEIVRSTQSPSNKRRSEQSRSVLNDISDENMKPASSGGCCNHDVVVAEDTSREEWFDEVLKQSLNVYEAIVITMNQPIIDDTVRHDMQQCFSVLSARHNSLHNLLARAPWVPQNGAEPACCTLTPAHSVTVSMRRDFSALLKFKTAPESSAGEVMVYRAIIRMLLGAMRRYKEKWNALLRVSNSRLIHARTNTIKRGVPVTGANAFPLIQQGSLMTSEAAAVSPLSNVTMETSSIFSSVPTSFNMGKFSLQKQQLLGDQSAAISLQSMGRKRIVQLIEDGDDVRTSTDSTEAASATAASIASAHSLLTTNRWGGDRSACVKDALAVAAEIDSMRLHLKSSSRNSSATSSPQRVTISSHQDSGSSQPRSAVDESFESNSSDVIFNISMESMTDIDGDDSVVLFQHMQQQTPSRIRCTISAKHSPSSS